MNRKQQPLNLLDLVLPATTADTNIHTFVEFKQWINTSFQIKTQLNVGDVGSNVIKQPEMITKTRKLKAAQSLVGDASQHNVNILTSVVKRVPTISYNMLDDIQQGMMQNSHISKQRSIRSRKYSNYNDELGLQLKENSIFDGKSAQSSRSFRGYRQINQYELGKRIGKGSFAQVLLASDIQTDQKYAIKIMDTKQLKKKFQLKKNNKITNNTNDEDSSQSQIKNIIMNKQSLASLFIRNEVAILKKMNHQYITKLHDFIVDNENSKVYLVLEYCGGGFINQSKEGQQYKKLLQSECKRYYKQLCLAIDYIHNVAKISHRDIKPQNILLSQNDQVKLSDFGLGTHKLKGSKVSGTPLYMPPPSEINEGDESFGNDIWALGVTLIVLLTGKTPEFTNQKIDKQKLLCSMKDVSENCKDFISRCLQPDYKKRIKAEQLLQHSWLNIGNDILKQSSINSLIIQISAADELNTFTTIQIKKQKQKQQKKQDQFKFTINI